uniref:Abelson helper integration site 1 n=1 Tax=Eptatretus burgeri TaxID=7764 RepID=A0A8C4NB42_EPTBU
MKLSELQCTDANVDERGLVKGKTEVTGDSTAEGDGRTKVEKMNKVNYSSWRLEPLSSQLHIQSLSEDGANAVVKAQKIRKKKKAVKADGHSIENDDAIGPARAEPAKQTDAVPNCKFEEDHQVLIVCVHRADALRTDPAHSLPVVRVHVVDELTGRHVLKEHRSAILPGYNCPDVPLHTMITCPYDFRQARSLRPEWEEQLIFSERFGRFIEAAHGGPRTLIFFEVCIQVQSSNRKQNPNEHEEMGKHALAWAFLKLEGANGTLNVGNKVRLQLFAPSVLRRISSNMLHVFEWYSRIGRQRYPSTLYVTVMAGQPPQQVGPTVIREYSFHPLLDPETQQVENSHSSLTNVSGQTQKWSRLPGQACQIPNKLLLSLPAGSAGCFRIAFSHDGQLLAVACAHRDIHPIRLYEIPSGKLLAELHGHLSIVYDLCWSSDDKHILSASADTTAQIWAIASPREASIILPHPAFVYAARFHPRLDVTIPSLAITGGYDGMLRAWTAEKPTAHLLRELEGHTGYVNAICFDPDGLMMFSGDSVGVILIWSTFVDQASVKEDELKGVPINHLNLHPNGRQLLVHAREGALRLLDLRISAIRKFTWLNNFHEWLHSTITPCGTFLFAGSESGSICIWNANTGDKVTMYSDLGFSVPARDVAYHPHDHLVAFCAYGENHRVLLYSYDHSGESQHLQIVALRIWQVVALYDYVARRSDEIALKCGDRLQVLYKDTVDWWFGIGTDGTQGYFPANYVKNKLIVIEFFLKIKSSSPPLLLPFISGEVRSH